MEEENGGVVMFPARIKRKKLPAILVVAGLSLLMIGSVTFSGGPRGAGAAEYSGASLDDLKGRSLLGLFSDNWATQMYAKTSSGEHSWVRNQKIELRWELFEPRHDTWDFSKYDAMINSALSEGSNSIMLLLNGPVPTWARNSSYGEYSYKAPPKNIADWYDFCAKVAERYGSVVDFYEVWNEPGWDIDSEAATNFDVRFFGAQVQTDYLPMLQSAYDAIKKNDGVAYIICGALPSSTDAAPTAGTGLYSQLFDDVDKPGQDVSMRIHSDQGVIAERPMYFNYSGSWTGGHDVLGATAPSSQWYFAEGYTGDGFDEWLCLQNPNDSAFDATVTYIFADGSAPMNRNYTLGANSRFTIKVNEVVGAGKDVSIKVTTPAGKPIVAERPMYFNYRGVWTGGHNVLGAIAPTSQWYFAEGYTGDGFDEWLCLMNPNAGAIEASVTYIFGDGSAPQTKKYQVQGNRRYTVNVNDAIGAGREVSLKVISTGGDIVAERPMYFAYKGVWTGGHNVVGCPTPGKSFYFAEGYTGEGFDEWLCLMNPNAGAIEASVTYIFADGSAPQTKKYQVQGNRRYTINVNDEAGRNRDVSITVTSPGDFVAERPMYFNFRGNITGGHNVIGASAPSQDWYFAEGCTGYGIEEWLCLQNPNASTANVDITYMMKAGQTLTKRITVAPRSRKTLNINEILGFSGNCDGVSVHPYKDPQYWGEHYAAVVQALASVGCNRELVATEIGWPNHSENPPGNSDAKQAEAIGDAGIGSLLNNGCKKIWVFKDVDEDPGTSWDYNYYGLFDYTGYPHPAWSEYKYWQSTREDYGNLPNHFP
jgi:hypothetical protein